MDVDKYILDIKNKLKIKGYVGKRITYSEFKELYEEYGTKMPEKDFAVYVLEIGINAYYGLKNGEYKTQILKEQLKQILKKDAEKMKAELISNGYAGKLIDYTELKKLHEEYANMIPEDAFAREILELSDNSYKHLKGERRKVYILRDLRSESQESIENIREQIRLKGYEEKLIDYEELQFLRKTYGAQFSESRFAQIVLEIGESSYLNAKNHGGKMVILKKRVATSSEEKIRDIKEQLKEAGYVGKSINYAEFKKLYELYGSGVTESRFATDILEIENSHFKRVKRGMRNAIILKSLKEEITSERIDEIKQKLENEGYYRKLVTYKELQKLHQTYGSDMPETKFALEVLGIQAPLLSKIRCIPKARARILCNIETDLSDIEIETIKEILEEKGYAGMIIDYSQFQTLYEAYGMKMNEEIFAESVLEILDTSQYKGLKEKNSRVQILCNNKKINIIKIMLLADSRWYTKEELEKICRENQVSLDRLISQIISNGTSTYNEDYKKVLDEKGKIWIGKTKFSKTFLEQNLALINQNAKIALNIVKKRYAVHYNANDDDIKEDAIIWLMENFGAVEKNFGDYPEIMAKNIFNILRKYMVWNVTDSIKMQTKTISLHEKLNSNKMSSKSKELMSKIAVPYDLEEDVLSRQDDSKTNSYLEKDEEGQMDLAEKCVQEMQLQIEEGLDKQTILSNMETKFRLSKIELLQLMQTYLINKGKVEIKKERVSWKEEEK